MKKVYFLLLWMFIIHGEAKDFYQVYDYNDTHSVTTTIQKRVSLQSVTITGKLHIHTVENNRTSYHICWLENRPTDKKHIDINSIYAPFVIENSGDKGFKISSLKSPSKDKEVKDRLMGIVDILQFVANKEGIYHFTNGLGSVEANQTITAQGYHLTYLNQYSKGKVRDDIDYEHTNIDIVPDTNNSLWFQVKAHENIHIEVSVPKATMNDKRYFLLSKNSKYLPKTHWFLQLLPDISTWDFRKIKTDSTLSLAEASKNFESKQNEIKALLDNREKLEEWFANNIDFLTYLSSLLENHTLDDKVSQVIFANLGYMNRSISTDILADVFLNENLNEKERFRSIMGLKNTSAPMDEEKLDELIDYGLSSSNDMLKRASGMILGSLAKNRADRVPEQYEKITAAISSAIDNEENKVVPLDAAGNMQQSASDRVLQSVENIFLSQTNALNLQKSAEALARIQRSNLTVSDFQNVFNHEHNSQIQAQIIRSSTVAKDFQSNTNYHDFLQTYTSQKINPKSNRLAALESLEKAGFGDTEEEKQTIRTMMVGEEDRDISKKLRDLYRK